MILLRKLKTKYIGNELHYFDEVDSTNEKADELAANKVEEGTVIIAERQKRGIGRFGRVWISPEGGIYVSIILKPKISPIDAPKITLITGIAVAKVIRTLGLDATLKWPNDVLIEGKKVGTFGIAGTFSFYPSKNLGAYGDAGAIITNDDEFAVKARMYSKHGALEKHKHKIEGINSRMDGLQAAVLSVKLPFIQE